MSQGTSRQGRDDPDHHAANIIGLYERHAQAFDSQRQRSGFEHDWLDAFSALLPPGGRVLDLGCGMAEPMASRLIADGFQITGVDSAPAMIAMCRQRFPAHAWHVGDMRRIDLRETFDGILAWNSFFHLTQEDQRHMFDVFAAHLATAEAGVKGALMFTSGPEQGIAMGSFEGEPLYHASLSNEEYRSLLTKSGFSVIRQRNADLQCNGHTVWLAQRA